MVKYPVFRAKHHRWRGSGASISPNAWQQTESGRVSLLSLGLLRHELHRNQCQGDIYFFPQFLMYLASSHQNQKWESDNPTTPLPWPLRCHNKRSVTLALLPPWSTRMLHLPCVLRLWSLPNHGVKGQWDENRGHSQLQHMHTTLPLHYPLNIRLWLMWQKTSLVEHGGRMMGFRERLTNLLQKKIYYVNAASRLLCVLFIWSPYPLNTIGLCNGKRH